MDKMELPNKIMIKEQIEEKEIIEQLLSQKTNHKVEIKIPQKGEKLRFVEMAEKNAKITLENQIRDKYNILNELKELLQLDKLPRKIECYDISNISGTNIVAGMCVAKDGEINRNLSRRFKIKTVIGQDDPKCINEVITRRLKHSIDNPNGGFGTLPDVIFVDGGITQIRAAREAVNLYGLQLPIYGMVKNDKHRTRALLNEKRQEIEISQEILNFITNLQDEVHKTAIEYHQKLRDSQMLKSELDTISGIGEIKKQLLYKKFGTVENMKNATIEELTSIKGITKQIANNIKQS